MILSFLLVMGKAHKNKTPGLRTILEVLSSNCARIFPIVMAAVKGGAQHFTYLSENNQLDSSPPAENILPLPTKHSHQFHQKFHLKLWIFKLRFRAYD